MMGFGTMLMIEREKPERTAAGMDAYGGKTGKALSAGTAALEVCAIRKNIRQEESNTEQPGHLSGLLLLCACYQDRGIKNRRMTMRPCGASIPLSTAGQLPMRWLSVPHNMSIPVFHIFPSS